MPPFSEFMTVARAILKKMPELRPYLTQAAREAPEVRHPLFAMQDKLVEHKFRPFPARFMEEAAGDIYREMTMRGSPNAGYMGEKVRKLRWPEQWSEGDFRVAREGAEKLDPENLKKYKAALQILRYATSKSEKGLGERAPVMNKALELMELMPTLAKGFGEYPYSSRARLKENTDAIEQLIKQFKGLD